MATTHRWLLTVGLILLVASQAAVLTVATPGNVVDPPDDDDSDGNETDDARRDDERDGGAPASGPEHNISNATWWLLWSEDVDHPEYNYSTVTNGTNVTTGGEAAKRLANSSDYVFARPPPAVPTWNAGEHRAWNGTGPNRSVIPPNTSTSAGEAGVITDAYIDIVRLGPSTILHHQGTTTRWIGATGRALLMLDYRVSLPANVTREFERNATTVRRVTTWALDATAIGPTTLRSNGTVHGTTSGEHTPAISYAGISPTDGPNRTFLARGKIEVTVQQINRTCSNYTDGRCVGTWTVTVTNRTYTHTVTDQQTVRVQTLATVSAIRYSHVGSTRGGVVVNTDEPWQGIEPTDRALARSTWWFYTRERPGWDVMVANSSTGSRSIDSPLRVVETHAFPASYLRAVVPNTRGNRSAATRPSSDFAMVFSLGSTPSQPPPLPDTISVEQADSYWTTSEVELIKQGGPIARDGTVTVHGIVANTSRVVDAPLVVVYDVAGIETQVIEENESAIRLEVVVWGDQTTDGRYRNPVERGRVAIRGAGAQTIEDTPGPALEFTIPKPARPISISFMQPDYEVGSLNYANKKTTLRDDTSLFPTIPELIRISWVLLVMAMPLVLLGYGLDRVTQGRLLGREDKYQ